MPGEVRSGRRGVGRGGAPSAPRPVNAVAVSPEASAHGPRSRPASSVTAPSVAACRDEARRCGVQPGGETFPFPAGLTPNVAAASYAADPRAIAVAEAAWRLVVQRDRWLNPPEGVDWLDEPAPGYPRRPVPRDETARRRGPSAVWGDTALCQKPLAFLLGCVRSC